MLSIIPRAGMCSCCLCLVETMLFMKLPEFTHVMAILADSSTMKKKKFLSNNFQFNNIIHLQYYVFV